MEESAPRRNRRQILRSRGIGAGVGTLIGAGWMAYGILWFPNVTRILIVLLSLTIIVPLLRASRQLVALSRELPAPEAAAQAASRRILMLFWLNFALEIVLLNIAINLLARPALQIYWIPAISFVVGLHFLPMAKFFEVPSYWLCGAAMIFAAFVTFLLIRSGALMPRPVIAAEALVNALILWLTAAKGVRSAAESAPR